jgi:hypothetical protein
MTNYRIYSLQTFTSSSVTSSFQHRAWGVLTTMERQGGITIRRWWNISLAHMITGQIYPCYPKSN